MAKHEVLAGQTDYTVLVFVPDSAQTDGSGKTGLVAANLTVSYARVETDNDVTITDVTSSLNNLAALTTAHTDWGLLEVSNTLAPGLYRLDIADAVFATGAWSAVVYVMVTTSAAAASPMEFVMVPNSPLTGVLLAPTTHTSAVIPTVTTTGTATAVTTVNGLAANVITAAATATDFGTEVANAVWDMDATGHQTTGTFGQAIGDPVADTTTIYAAVVTAAAGTHIAADIIAVKAQTAAIEVDTAEIGAAGAGLTAINLPNQTMDIVGSITGNLSGSVGSVTGAVGSVTGLTAATVHADLDDIQAKIGSPASTVSADIAAVKAETAAIVADTNELQTDWADGGRLDLILDARASQASVNTVDGIVDDILLDTAEIGAAGAGLTAINLPNQTMDIVGNITGNLSGSVGSVTGAVGSVTGLTAADVGAIKAQTDKFVFTIANEVNANVQYINDVAITGDGSAGDKFDVV